MRPDLFSAATDPTTGGQDAVSWVQGVLDLWVVIGPLVGGVIGALLTGWIGSKRAREDHERALQRSATDRRAETIARLYTGIEEARMALNAVLISIIQDEGGRPKIQVPVDGEELNSATEGFFDATQKASLYSSPQVNQLVTAAGSQLLMVRLTRDRLAGQVGPDHYDTMMQVTVRAMKALGDVRERMRVEVGTDNPPEGQD